MKGEAGSGESEEHRSASTHFKSSSLICEEPENSETKRQHYKGAIILSAGESAGQTTAGEVRRAAYCPFDEHFPTFSVATDERMAGSLHFSLCRGCCQALLNTLPFCLLSSPSVTLDFKPQSHPRLHITVCPPSQPVSVHYSLLQDKSNHVAVSRARKLWWKKYILISCCALNKQQLVSVSSISEEAFLQQRENVRFKACFLHFPLSQSDPTDRW